VIDGGGRLVLVFFVFVAFIFFFSLHMLLFLVLTQLSLLSWHIPYRRARAVALVASAVCRARASPNR